MILCRDTHWRIRGVLRDPLLYCVPILGARYVQPILGARYGTGQHLAYDYRLIKGQKICPSMYDCTTSTNPQTKEKTRYSQRLQSMGEQPNLGNCAEISAPDTEMKARERHDTCRSSISSTSPEWTGKPVISDDPETLKWLGTRIWPLENEEKENHLAMMVLLDREGKIIAEKRLQLKRELGSAFYSWGFHKMGEEVALSWTEEEERKFKSIVSLNPPSLDKNYWDHLYINFPSKGRKNLVSYYFNVFLLWRRSYQNRVTPNNIDSDDEESEFGFLSNPFGHDAIIFRDPACLTCSQNTQCMDIDE
ncbi:AT-rich interactive domain-containing protein 2 [Ananas comosus]|uniref:AT-rich interactive domain-containing protein 2 n=1 Tax=Ananas comosus TaxID=4615 RepID=A0A199VCG7_ANACO|nr:AT-rich interactive domain-containing protein 2 [Ananas comosus]